MTRGTGWLFPRSRPPDRARRSSCCAARARAFDQSPIDWDAAMRMALELCDSTITYRWRYLGQLQPAPVLDLVVLDDSNPRALAFQLRSIESHLERLGPGLGRLRARAAGPVRQATSPAAVQPVRRRGEGMAARRPGARHAARGRRETASGSRQLCEAITRAYFSHVPAAQAVGSMRREAGMQYLLSHRTSYTYATSVDSAHHIAHLRARPFPGQKVSSISIRTQPDSGARRPACRPFRQPDRHLPHRQAAPALRHRGARRGRRAFPDPPPAAATPPWEEVAPRWRRRLPDADRGQRVRPRLAAGAARSRRSATTAPIASRPAGRSSRRRASSGRIKADFDYHPGATDI